MMRPGDIALVFAMYVWLTIAVGPWWVSVSVFLGCGAINALWQYKMRESK